MSDEHLLDESFIGNEIELRGADLGLRFANMLIDGIVLAGVSFVLGLIIGTSPTFELGFLGDFALVTSGWTIRFIYYTAMEATLGQTIGKMVTGTYVVDEYGEPVDFGKAALRTLIRFLGLLDALSFFFFGDRRGWHDRWGRTYVIKKQF
mgnify:CR=1 FL=1